MLWHSVAAITSSFARTLYGCPWLTASSIRRQRRTIDGPIVGYSSSLARLVAPHYPKAMIPSSTSSSLPKDLTGKAFERLVAAVQRKLSPGAIVEWDIKIRAKSGATRQIDVMVRGTMDGADVAIAIEAKDRNKPITPNMVGAFHAAFTGIGAQHGIMVSNLGFTKDALLEAQDKGIFTCILRPAKDADWEGYLRQAQMTIQSHVLSYKDMAVVLANGTTVPGWNARSFIIHDSDGKMAFFDRIVNVWLNNRDNKWTEGQLLELETNTPFFLDDERIATFRFRPEYVDGFTIRSLLTRPEDWVFVQQMPSGTRDEKSFFVFVELERLANEFNAVRLAKKASSKRKAKKTSS